MPQSVKLGLVDQLNAESVGVPGQRTFNINAVSEHGSCAVWIEKEQLFNIAESLGRALDLLSEMGDADAVEGPPLGYRDIEPGDIDFKAWNIEMQYDDRRKLFFFKASGPDPEADRHEALEAPEDHEATFYFSHEQARHLTTRGLEVVYAGRPLCPHCGVPMNQGEEHVCERRNGYHPDEAKAIVRIIEDQ